MTVAKFQSNHTQSGQSLLEVIIALAIFSLISAALASLSVGGFAALEQGGEQTEAEALAQEGIEAVRSIRDRAWNENTYDQAKVQISGNEWVFGAEGSTETIGQYTRTITFAAVCRDGNDDIASCPATYKDVHLKEATVSVTWSPRTGITNEVKRVAYVTNWDSADWTQSDWVGSTGQATWVDETKYDSDDGNIEQGNAGQISLVSGDTTDNGFEADSGGDLSWPFTTSGNYNFDGDKIEVTGGQAQLTLGAGTIEGDTTNNEFTTNADDWSFATWGKGGGEVTPTGSWQAVGGNLAGYVDINIPSDARRDTVGGYWEQSIEITEDSAAVTCSFDWSITQWVAASGVDDYQFYVFLDSASGEPTLGQQVWASGTQGGTSGWSGQQDIDCAAKAPTSGTYYYKIAVWLDAKNTSTGPISAGYDNAKVHWEKDGAYPTDEPTIDPTNSISASGVSSWDSFVETATKNGGEIYYQLTNDNGATWQYWNGSAWVVAATATHYNLAADVNTNITSFSTLNEQIKFKAFLVSNGSQRIQLDSITIAYSTGGSPWKFATWDVGGGETAPTGTLQTSSGNPNGYADVAYLTSTNDEVGGYWEQTFTTYKSSPSAVTIDFDYKVVDFNGLVDVADIRIYVDTASGTPTNQVGSSIGVTGEGDWTSAAQIDATAATPTAGVYYLKVAFWLETGTGAPDGPFAIGYDNLDLELNDAEHPTSGWLISSDFDTGSSSKIQVIEWDEVVPGSAYTNRAQIKTASTQAGLSSASWSGIDGKDGDETDYFTIGKSELIHTDHNDDRWIRYRLQLDGDGDDTPVLTETRINYK